MDRTDIVPVKSHLVLLLDLEYNISGYCKLPLEISM